MVEFIKVPKKMPFKRRLELVSVILNRKGEVSVEDLVFGWGVTSHYAMTILKWTQKKYSYAEWNGMEQTKSCPYPKEGRVKEIPSLASSHRTCASLSARTTESSPTRDSKQS